MSEVQGEEARAAAFFNNTPLDGIEDAVRHVAQQTGDTTTYGNARAAALEHTKHARAVGLTGEEYAIVLRESHRMSRVPEAERATLQQQARDALRREFGNDADAALADASALVQRDPAFAKLLGAGGDSPAVVLALARAARRSKR